MSTRAWIAFASVSVLWGIPYLFIKVAVDDGMRPWWRWGSAWRCSGNALGREPLQACC